MSEKRQVNGPPARLGRLAGLLASVILVAVIYLLSPGSPPYEPLRCTLLLLNGSGWAADKQMHWRGSPSAYLLAISCRQVRALRLAYLSVI